MDTMMMMMMGITPSISTSSDDNSEEEDVDLEYIFHQRLTWMILGLSPIVFLILIRQTLPTYGKHSMHNQNHNTNTKHKESSLEQQKQEISKEKNASSSSLSHSAPSSSSTTLSSSSRTTLRHRRNKNKNKNSCTDGNVEVEEETVSTKIDDEDDDDADRDQYGSNFDDNDRRRRTEKRRTQKLLQSFHYWFFSPLLPPNIAWFLFESPCWIWVLLCLYDHHHVNDSATDGRSSNVGGEQEQQQQSIPLPMPTLPYANQLLLGWFFFHYIYRSIIYPFMMTHTTTSTTTTNHKKRKGFPIGVAFVAWLYCVMNGYLQARYLTKFYHYHENGIMKKTTVSASSSSSSSSFDTIQFWVGCGLIVIGFSIVVTSDCILLNLKKQQPFRKKQKMMTQNNTDSVSSSQSQSQHQYSIPYGGFFYFVSSPHYFGEILEWSGFCLAASTCGGPHSSSFCALSFVIWTCANLIPRALHTHEWYQHTFQNHTSDHNDNNTTTTTNNNNDGDGNGTIRNDNDDDDSVDYSQLNRTAIIPFIL